MDINKLLLAAEVNKLAQKFRQTDRNAFVLDLPNTMSVAEKDEKKGEWDKNNGIKAYFSLAYRELISTAATIDEIEEAERNKALSGLEQAIAAGMQTPKG